MNENDVKPVTGIKEQMKGSWMSLILMVVCLFTMFLVPVFRYSGEAFSQDLGIKIYAKLGWLPLMNRSGLEQYYTDNSLFGTTSNLIIFWAILISIQFLVIAAWCLLVKRKGLSLVFCIIFIIGNIVIYFARCYYFNERNGTFFEKSKMGVGIYACCFGFLLLSYIQFQNKKVLKIMFYILCSVVTLTAAGAIVYTKIDKEKTVEILEDITPVYANKEEAAIEIAKKIGVSYEYDIQQYSFYEVVDDQHGRYAVIFKNQGYFVGVYVKNPNYLTGGCSDYNIWEYYDEDGTNCVEILESKIEDWRAENSSWVAELPDSYDEFSRDTEVKKGNVIEYSSWEYDISRLNEEEMR